MTQVSKISNRLRARPSRIRMALIASLIAAGAFAQDPDTPASELVHRYSGRIDSTETAERALADVGKERSAVEQRFAADKRTCYDDFFATACIDKAKERRRVGLEQLRRVEVDAKAFQRQAQVKERDQELEEKRLERERMEAERLKMQQAAPQANAPKAAIRKSAPPQAGGQDGGVDPREARHRAKLNQLEVKQRAEAQKRADNVASYERKVRQAEERQRKVEEAKRKKELERAARSP